MKIAEKLWVLLGNWRFAWVLARHGVAAAVEHLEAIRLCAPATLVDVGANKGQFALAVRGLFPCAAVLAFEPLPQAADIFETIFGKRSNARLHRFALGGENGLRAFHVANRRDCSSLLKPNEEMKRAYGVTSAEEIVVQVRRLEDVIDLSRLTPPVLLKIDVQGAELDVLKGIDRLDAFDFIHVETSFVELYEGQPLFDEISFYLKNRGFVLEGLFNLSVTKPFGLTQADCLFTRAEGK